MPLKKKREKAAVVEKSTPTRRKRQFQPALYINGVAYEFGVECGFCAARPAIVHCNGCPEFLCGECDLKIHSHKKHQYHTRKPIPRFNLDGASDRIKGFFRYLEAREVLRNKCRQRFARFYDPGAKRYYYFDKRNRAAQWTKPICLKSSDLRPPLTQQEAIRRLQSFIRSHLARKMMRDLTHHMFERIYDPIKKRCFYYFKGEASYIARVRWEKPPFLYKIGDELKIKLTDHVAAMRIQYHWRKFLIRRLLRRLLRRDFRRVLDPTMGTYCYWTPDGEYLRRSPYILGSNRWEANNMMLWTEDEIRVFLRRIGLKQYVKNIAEFHVDGALLLACEDLDFQLIGISSPFHVKKIRTAIKQTHQAGEEASAETSVWARRKQIRALYESNHAALLIQKNFRAFLGKKKFREFKSRLAVLRSREKVEKDIVPKGIWYTELLPPFVPVSLKAFGKRRPHRGACGFGEWGAHGWSSSISESHMETFDGLEPDGHDSCFWVKKLNGIVNNNKK